MNKGTLIMFCGLPGSGKSTFAEKLEKERNAVRMWPDYLAKDLLGDHAPKEIHNRIHGIVEEYQFELAQRLLELDMTVILENGFWAEEERNYYRDTAKNLGAKVELYFFETPFETLWQRIEKRNNDLPRGTFYIAKHDLEKWHKQFEPPTEKELASYDVGKVIVQ